MSKQQQTNWSDPYHGVTHGSADGKKSYVTVTQYSPTCALATFNAYPVRGNERQQTFDTVDAAKQAGDEWLTQQVL